MLRAPRERRPRRPEPADHVLLGLEGRRRPVLEPRADPPRDEVAPAADPWLVGLIAHPHEPIERVGLVGLQVVGPVLEAEQVARGHLGRRRRRRPREPHLQPAQRDSAEPDACQVPHGVEGDLLVLRACLHAQVAPAALLIEVVTGEGGEVGQRGRAPRREPEPSVEERRSDAEGEREPGRPEAGRLAGVRRRQPRVLRSRDGITHDEALGGGGPGPQQCHEVAAGERGDVEGGEHQPVLRRGRDPGLVRAVEADGADRRRRGRRRRGGERHEPAGCDGGAGEQRAPGEPQLRVVACRRVVAHA